MKHIDIPQDNYENDYEFISLSKQCRKGNTDAMLAMSDYFEALHKKYEKQFYQLAANFWHYFALKKGNPVAREWFNMWLKENPGVPFPSVISVPICGNFEGSILHALGFPFFKPDKEYFISEPDSIGIVEVSSYVDEDGPDEDGFGREIYYDWWYLSDCLEEFSGIKCIHSYSIIDKNANKELFQKMYDIAVREKKSTTK